MIPALARSMYLISLCSDLPILSKRHTSIQCVLISESLRIRKTELRDKTQSANLLSCPQVVARLIVTRGPLKFFPQHSLVQTRMSLYTRLYTRFSKENLKAVFLLQVSLSRYRMYSAAWTALQQ